jgi:hypothetical protein
VPQVGLLPSCEPSPHLGLGGLQLMLQACLADPQRLVHSVG